MQILRLILQGAGMIFSTHPAPVEDYPKECYNKTLEILLYFLKDIF